MKTRALCLSASFFVCSFCFASKSSFHVSKLNCEGDPDGVLVEILNEHVVRVHTAAMEDEYYRTISNEKDTLLAEHVFDAYKSAVDGRWTVPGNSRSLTLLKQGKSVQATFKFHTKKSSPVSYNCTVNP